MNKLPLLIVIIFLSFSCVRKADNKQEKSSNQDVNRTSKSIEAEIEKGDEIEGKIVKVDDGDTYALLLPNNETVKIRMEGIDAPEGGMPFYKVTKNYLGDMAAGKKVITKITDKDQYGRYLGLTHLDSLELSAEMLKAGMAWHYKKFNSDTSFAALEAKAKKEKKGLWEESNPVPPWIHRMLRPRGVSTKDLNVYSLKTVQVSKKEPEAGYKDIKIKTNWSSSEDNTISELVISKNGQAITTLEAIKGKSEQDFIEVNLADYNMDGEIDMMIEDEQGPKYYLFVPEKNAFDYHKDWNFYIWKLNKPKKQILTTSDGDAYAGKVLLYQVEDDFEVDLQEVIRFDTD